MCILMEETEDFGASKKRELGYPGSKGVRGPPGMKGQNGVCEVR